MQYDISEKGCVRFTDTNGITFDMWHKILIQLNHLGYAMPDEDGCKDYFDRHCYLQPDQSRAILQLFGKEHKQTKYTQSKINKDLRKAIARFGITDDFKKAGYLLPDGQMLNFCECADFDNRTLDHRQIHEILDERYEQPTQYLIQFMNYGNIRILYNGFEISTRPTSAQKITIARFIKTSPESFFVDISNMDGHVVKSMYYTFPTTAQILTDINDYFNQIEI